MSVKWRIYMAWLLIAATILGWPGVTVPILNKRVDTIPKGAVYIGRPSEWGNPYTHLSSTLEGTFQVETREQAIDEYERYAKRRLAKEPEWLDPLRYATALVCWCAPADCHGRVLMELLRSRP